MHRWYINSSHTSSTTFPSLHCWARSAHYSVRVWHKVLVGNRCDHVFSLPLLLFPHRGCLRWYRLTGSVNRSELLEREIKVLQWGSNTSERLLFPENVENNVLEDGGVNDRANWQRVTSTKKTFYTEISITNLKPGFFSTSQWLYMTRNVFCFILQEHDLW